MSKFRWQYSNMHVHKVYPDPHSYHVGEHFTSVAAGELTLQQLIPASMVNHKYTRETWVDIPKVST